MLWARTMKARHVDVDLMGTNKIYGGRGGFDESDDARRKRWLIKIIILF